MFTTTEKVIEAASLCSISYFLNETKGFDRSHHGFRNKDCVAKQLLDQFWRKYRIKEFKSYRSGLQTAWLVDEKNNAYIVFPGTETKWKKEFIKDAVADISLIYNSNIYRVKQIEDAINYINVLKSLLKKDYKNVFFLGHSLGATTVLALSSILRMEYDRFHFIAFNPFFKRKKNFHQNTYIFKHGKDFTTNLSDKNIEMFYIYPYDCMGYKDLIEDHSIDETLKSLYLYLKLSEALKTNKLSKINDLIHRLNQISKEKYLKYFGAGINNDNFMISMIMLCQFLGSALPFSYHESVQWNNEKRFKKTLLLIHTIKDTLKELNDPLVYVKSRLA